MKTSKLIITAFAVATVLTSCKTDKKNEATKEQQTTKEMNTTKDTPKVTSDIVEITVSEKAEPQNFIRIVNDNHAIVHTEILINAPIEKVWKTATNFKDMSWTPVFKGLEGDLKDGNTVDLNINFDGKIQKFPQVLTWVEGQRFGWKGASPYGDFLHDNHMYYFVAVDSDKTLVIQSDQPTSTDLSKMNLADKAVIKQLKGNVVNNYMKFNLGLKEAVEGKKGLTQPDVVIEVLDDTKSPNMLSVFSPYRSVNHAEIVIDAPAEKVWEVVTDFEKYPEFSSTYQNLKGEKKNGNTVMLAVKLQNGEVKDFPMLLRWVDGQRFGWSGGSHSYDNHMFMVIPQGDKTLFIQTDDVTNTDRTKTDLTNEATLNFIKGVAEKNFATFNQELKKRVESLK